MEHVSQIRRHQVQPPPTQNANILIVDDRRDIRFLTGRILSDVGMLVDFCENGAEAIDYITDAIGSTALPDLVLLDMQMPVIDGYQTATRLRELGYVKPIIALTADAMQGDMQRCLDAGCTDYLGKPIVRSELLNCIYSSLASDHNSNC